MRVWESMVTAQSTEQLHMLNDTHLQQFCDAWEKYEMIGQKMEALQNRQVRLKGTHTHTHTHTERERERERETSSGCSSKKGRRTVCKKWERAVCGK